MTSRDERIRAHNREAFAGIRESHGEVLEKARAYLDAIERAITDGDGLAVHRLQTWERVKLFDPATSKEAGILALLRKLSLASTESAQRVKAEDEAAERAAQEERERQEREERRAAERAQRAAELRALLEEHPEERERIRALLSAE